RAPRHPGAGRSVAEVAGGYSNLEVDLASGRRGQRSAHLEPLLCELFGAEAAHVVHNCAGATMLALAALGKGGAAIVSRGELVEIGRGFRVPEIPARSGCRLIEVGSTDRTRVGDYAAALTANPATSCWVARRPESCSAAASSSSAAASSRSAVPCAPTGCCSPRWRRLFACTGTVGPASCPRCAIFRPLHRRYGSGRRVLRYCCR